MQLIGDKVQFKVQGSMFSIVRRTSHGGFTLIEILVAMVIFAIATLGLAMGVASIMRANQTSYFTTIATSLAQDKLEELKANPASIASCATNCDNPVPIFDNVTFTRTWVVTEDTPVAGVKQIEVTVTWTNYTDHSLTMSSAVKE